MFNGKRVIIVEDDRDISGLISYNLRKEGFLTEEFADGGKAMNRIGEEIFDIVVLDIMLPGVDGFEICRAINDDPRYSRSFVIMVSAKCREQDRLYAHLLGADYYLTKPFDLTELISAARESSALLDREYLIKTSG